MSTKHANDLPLVKEIPSCPDPADVFAAFADEPALVFLDSALAQASVGRYSFLTARPFQIFETQDCPFGSDPFALNRRCLPRYQAAAVPDLPPFQGGAVGLLSYELGSAWERIPRTNIDEFQLPNLVIGLFDWVIAWDHVAEKCWVISHGFSAKPGESQAKAAARIQSEVLDRIGDPPPTIPIKTRSSVGTPRRITPISKQWAVPGYSGLSSDFSREDYLQAVERVIEYIHAGDIFQANLSQRLLAPLDVSPIELYRRLRKANPAPFAAYFSHDDWAVASASPERFLRFSGGEVETRPIKGTRRRQPAPEADLYTRDVLRESEKDQAENVMIVDLLRNDLSRVCQPGSIRVPALCRVETFETVQHLVSEIRGQLEDDVDVWDLFAATFPGGSITGAPKVRAMEIIHELEPTVRGPYCGNVFYVGFNGECDSSILIRTFVCRHGWIQCSVGGGIVADSDPLAEYEETWHKAEAMLRAL